MEIKRKIALLAALSIEEEKCVKTYRRWYERPHILERKKQGDFYSLLHVTRLSDPECFFNNLHVTPEIFDNLLSLVSPLIYKKSLGREALPTGLRLGLTLRYLASGDSMCSMSFQHRIGKSTTSAIIKETCESLWITLMHNVLKIPSKQRWEEIERDFNRMWQVPNCVGAIDGKHVIIQCPHNGGSMYYNYKHTHSIVLLASCDARYHFTMVDIGAYGRQSDGGIFAVSNMGKNILQNNLLVPPPKNLPCTNVSVPHVSWQMKPSH